MKYCPYCGTYLKNNKIYFCPECGRKLFAKNKKRRLLSVSSISTVSNKKNKSQSSAPKSVSSKIKKRLFNKLCIDKATCFSKISGVKNTKADNYYDDILPEDVEQHIRKIDFFLIKRIIIVITIAVMIVILSLIILTYS